MTKKKPKPLPRGNVDPLYVAQVVAAARSGQGHTVDMTTGRSPSGGYMASLSGHQEDFDPSDPQLEARLHDYVARKSRPLGQKKRYLGTWLRGDGRLVADVSERFLKENMAHAFARRHDQDAIWDYAAEKKDPNYGGTDTMAPTPHEEALIKKYHDNIVHSYNKTSAVDKAAGREWYAEEGQKIRDWAKRYGYEPDRALQAFAVMSPNMDWNLVQAHMTAIHNHGPNVRQLDDGKGTRQSFGTILKAHRVLNGEHMHNVLSTEAPKVSRFYRNLRDAHDDKRYVTVDGHATNIADHDFERKGITESRAIRPYDYGLIEEAYRRAAKTLNVEVPHHIQAATWIGYKHLSLKKNKEGEPIAPNNNMPDEDEGDNDILDNPGKPGSIEDL